MVDFYLMTLPCGIHDVDLMMTSVHNWEDLLTWATKYSLLFLVLAVALVIVCKPKWLQIGESECR